MQPSVPQNYLQKKVCDILLVMIEACGVESNQVYLKIKDGRTIIKFSSRQKSSEILTKKKKLKNIAIDKFTFTTELNIFISGSLCPYYRGLWGKFKTLRKTGKYSPSIQSIEQSALKNMNLVKH